MSNLQPLLQATLTGAVMILTTVILRLRFSQQTPRRVFCLMWDIVLLRLMALVRIPALFSVSLPSLQTAAPQLQISSGSMAEMEIASTVTEDFAIRQIPAMPTAPIRLPLFPIWCTGAVLCAAWLLWGHLQSRSLYAMSLPVEDEFIRRWQDGHPLRRFVQVRRSDRIAAPLTYGILQPVVLLPSRMDLSDRENLSYILEHEYTHIRRCDTLRKALLAAGLCLHWFNPFVWLFYRLANRDIELACDEAVIRSGADRTGYALALLRMEEERGGTVLSGSHFSGHALEERIEAIMKHKNVSLAALLAVLTVMVVMTMTATVFAAGAPDNQPDASPEFGLVTGRDISVVTQDMLTISRGPDGEKYYSADGGETWMNEEQYHAHYGSWGDGWKVEWWTYEEYKEWLEQEKRDLADITGARGYTSDKGWFVWDQAMVDETVALYEKTLEDIKNGALYSKNIIDSDGSVVEDAMLGSGTGSVIYSYESGEKTGSAEASWDAASLLESYRAFGVTGNERDGLYYNGQLIHYLVDGFSVWDNGYGIKYTYMNDMGTVDVHTLYEATPLPGGGVDPSGKLTGFVQRGGKGFDASIFDVLLLDGPAQTAFAISDAEGGSLSQPGRTFAEIFADYAAYGIRYDEAAENELRLTCNGEPVSRFADLKPDGSAFSYENPYSSGGLSVITDYQNGQLSGLTVK
ncbi:MAG: M56 family metallopeptidase [Oscillospiraceae bacterium]|nr:M56 family metallopeptidase [Oscillospiraceae bacterium]